MTYNDFSLHNIGGECDCEECQKYRKYRTLYENPEALESPSEPTVDEIRYATSGRYDTKPAPDPRRYEIAKAALEKLATYKGLWDGDRYSIDEGSVNGIAREALALIAELDKEAAK